MPIFPPGNPFSQDITNALNGANSPSATNVVATMDDLPGNELTAEQLLAIQNANSPDGTNYFATIGDVPALSGDQVDAITNANSPDGTNYFATIGDIPALSSDQVDAITNANSPDGTNYFATIGDVPALSGDQVDAITNANSPNATNYFSTINDLTKYENVITYTKEPSGIFNASELTFSGSGSTLNITSTSNKIKYFYQGVYKELACPTSKAITETIGETFIVYLTDSNTIDLKTPATLPTPEWYSTVPLLAICYWNGTELFIQKETHGIVMDAATHDLIHTTIGCRYQNDGGFAGSFNNTGFSLTRGTIKDEDLSHTIEATSLCRVYYRDSSIWKRTAAQAEYYYTNGGNIHYDNGTTRVPCSSNYYVAYWIYASNDVDAPIISIMGQGQYNTIQACRSNSTPESLILGTLPAVEMKLLFRVIVRNDATPYEETLDYRSSSIIGAVNSQVVTHASLAGLSNDDHPQYLLRTENYYISPQSQSEVEYSLISDVENKVISVYSPEVTLAAGSYALDISNIFTPTTIIGDERELAGLSYIHSSTIVSTRTNAGSGTISLSSSGNEITVTGSTTSPDFSEFVAGDRVICTNTSGTIAIYTISAVAPSGPNSIQLTTAAPTINGVGACITLVPNRTITTAQTIRYNQDITFLGFYFDSIGDARAISNLGRLTLYNTTMYSCGTNSSIYNSPPGVVYTTPEVSIISGVNAISTTAFAEITGTHIIGATSRGISYWANSFVTGTGIRGTYNRQHIRGGNSGILDLTNLQFYKATTSAIQSGWHSFTQIGNCTINYAGTYGIVIDNNSTAYYYDTAAKITNCTGGGWTVDGTSIGIIV